MSDQQAEYSRVPNIGIRILYEGAVAVFFLQSAAIVLLVAAGLSGYVWWRYLAALFGSPLSRLEGLVPWPQDWLSKPVDTSIGGAIAAALITVLAALVGYGICAGLWWLAKGFLSRRPVPMTIVLLWSILQTFENFRQNHLTLGYIDIGYSVAVAAVLIPAIIDRRPQQKP